MTYRYTAQCVLCFTSTFTFLLCIKDLLTHGLVISVRGNSAVEVRWTLR